MKLTKTLIAAAATVAFAFPMTASAQVGMNEVIGSLQNVTGPVYIQRGDQILRAIESSAVMPMDKIVAEAGGSTMVNLNGCNGKFQPCNQFVGDGNMVFLNSGNYCGDLASLLPMSPGDAVLTAAANSPVGYTGPSIGTAMSQKTLLAILGTAVVGGGLYAILDNDDDDEDDVDTPTSP